MFDIRWIAEDAEAFDHAMARRGLKPQAAALLALDEKRRATLTELQRLQERRNAASKKIGQAMAAGDREEAERLKAEVAALKNRLQELEERARRQREELERAMAVLPNMPLDEVPDGEGEDDNVEVRKVGAPPAFDFAPKEHYALGEALGLMDFEAAAKMSGARFVVLKGALARLQRALGQFMLDVQTAEAGYAETDPPLLVRDAALFGTGQLPKFAEDLFATTDGRWLIPTAEVPLTNLVRDSIVEEEALPMRVCALTPCFRAEAGAAGRDTRGMIRQHQFPKVELVSITTPEDGRAELDRKLAAAEDILKRLELPYRVVLLCAQDMGAAARITFDLEVWLPGQARYREISSVSLCGDYQARRMNARYRPAGDKKPRFVHTLNGSGLAVGRALVAVMENYQNADGTITVPDALRPYMGGLKVIG
ncbi:MAG TPA: serine--tRNA ligase [Thermopetrobacter sp.]|nr:serine--tRNA ligase [Thermopetrobacter sp.]